MEVSAAYHYIGNQSEFVSAGDSDVIAIEHFEIRGRWISSDVATLSNDGPFLTITLSVSEEDDAPYLEKAKEEIASLRNELTPDEWLEGTTDETLILPVSVFHWLELVPA